MNRFQIRPITLLALSVIAAPMVAQESTGQIVGSIRTKAGEPVVGAEIRLNSTALQGTRVVVTDAKGAFRAPLLPPGAYRITVVKEGYLAPRATADVGLGSIVRQDIIVGKAAESTGAVVEVIAAAAAIDKTDVKASTNITSEMMDVLPRTTRGMDTVALLSPGVTTNSAAGGRITMRGGQTTGNRFLLNGTDVADNVFGDTSGRNFYVDDSIGETQVIQSPVSARYGNFTGGIINAITKSGSNEFTGVLRANVNRNSWSAIAPRGTRPGVVPTNAGTNASEDLRNVNYTLLVGGPIIKDRLWFSVSTKKDPETSTTAAFSNVTGLDTLYGDPSYQPATSGQPYTQISTTKFWEGKLTFAINSNHSVDFSSSKNESTRTNRGVGGEVEPAALYDYKGINKYWSFGYRGILSSNLNLEARYSVKQDSLGGGGRSDAQFLQRINAAYSNGSYYAFNNGAFKADAPDNRDVKTATANLTWFSPETAIGTWTVDVGFELLNRERQAPNDQSPTGNRMFLDGRAADGTYHVTNWVEDPDQWNTLEIGISGTGAAKTNTSSFYANGTLAVNDKFQVMVGARYDSVEAKDTLGSPNIKSSKFSPRFQVTYDVLGDQAWLLRGSFATYVGSLHDGFTNKFTFAGNPIREWYGWGAATGYYSYADVTNLSNWAINADGFQGVGGASGNFVDSKLKSPSVDEYSFDVKHGYRDGSYFKIGVVRRLWKDMYNDFLRIGDVTTYTPRAAAGIPEVGSPATRWETDNRIKREYTNVEFEFDARLSSLLRLGGNYTYAVLRGNGEGGDSGGSNTGPVGDVLGNYESVHASRGRDVNYYAPMGYLNSDQRHRAGIHLDYINRTKAGVAFNASMLLNYSSGGAYSLTRTNSFEARVDGAAAGVAPSIVQQLPTTYTRFFGERGFGRFNDTFNCDLKMGVDVPVVSKVRYFLEVTVFNVFNHWQLGGLKLDQTAGTTVATDSPLAGYYATPQNMQSTGRFGYGTTSYTDYVGGRSVRVSTGIKW